MKLSTGHLLLALTLAWTAATAPSIAQSAEWYMLSDAGCIARDNGNYEQAERMLSEALREAETCGPEATIPPTLNKLAVVYLADGKTIQAELFFMRAIDVIERLSGPDEPQLATNLTSLGTLYVSQKKYRAAEPLLKRALAISEKSLPASDAVVGGCACNLADLYIEQGKYAEAESLSRKAIENQEAGGKPDIDLMRDLRDKLNLAVDAQGKDIAPSAVPLLNPLVAHQISSPVFPVIANH